MIRKLIAEKKYEIIKKKKFACDVRFFIPACHRKLRFSRWSKVVCHASHRIAWHNLSTGCRLNLSTQQNAWGNRFLLNVQCRWQHWYTLMFFISPDAACTSMSLVCSWTATAFIKTSMRIIENLLENCVRSCLFLKFHFFSYKYWLKVWENVSVIFTHVRVDCTNPGVNASTH